MVKYLARTDHDPQRRVVGEPIRLSLDPAEFTETVEVLAPGDEGDRTTRLQASPESRDESSPAGTGTPEAEAKAQSPPNGSPSLRLNALYRDTDEPGIYTVRLLRQSQVSEDQLIAYNTPPIEGGLTLASTAEIRKRIGNATGVTIQEFGQLDWVEGREAGGEIRQWLLWGLLALFLLEQALAYKLSYHPPPLLQEKTMSAMT